MAPPQLDGMMIVVAVIHSTVKKRIQPGMFGIFSVWIKSLHFGAYLLEKAKVFGRCHTDIPACQFRLDQHFDLDDVSDEIRVHRPHPCAAIGLHDDEALAALNNLPREEMWSTSKYLRHIPKLFEALRHELGYDVELLHDAHHRLTPLEAARLGKDLEPYRLFWLEDTVAAEHQEGFRLIRKHTVTPLAVGEVFNTIWDARLLIEEQLIDYIRMTTVHAGGVTPLRRIMDLAGIYNVRTACHGAMDMSPVCLATNLHLGLWAPNFGIQEYTPYLPETLEVFPGAWTAKDGYLHPGNAPGHGVDIDETLAAKYPYERSYLPVNRLEDGTLWHW